MMKIEYYIWLLTSNTHALDEKSHHPLSHPTYKVSSTSKPWRFNRIRKAFGERMHIEAAIQNDQQNRDYCSKSDFWEVWHLQPEPKRRKLNDVADMVASKIIKGTPLDEVITMYPRAYLKWGTNMEKLNKRFNHPKARNFKTEVYYIWGEPGLGKLRMAPHEALETGEKTYNKPRGQWWDF